MKLREKTRQNRTTLRTGNASKVHGAIAPCTIASFPVSKLCDFGGFFSNLHTDIKSALADRHGGSLHLLPFIVVLSPFLVESRSKKKEAEAEKNVNLKSALSGKKKRKTLEKCMVILEEKEKKGNQSKKKVRTKVSCTSVPIPFVTLKELDVPWCRLHCAAEAGEG